MTMAGNVNIPFRKRLEIGETQISINVPRKFLNHSDRTFGFQTITLMPEYQSKQAFAYNMDPASELQTIVSHDVQLQVTYLDGFYNKDSTTWSHTPTTATMGPLLKQLNQHFDAKKPPGSIWPPVVFDWVHLVYMTEDDLRKAHQNNAEEFYGVEYDEGLHGNALPPSVNSLKSFNNMLFPTNITEEMLEFIRIRMFLAANVTVAFSNEVLPKLMGFTESQIPARNSKNQVAFANTTSHKFEYHLGYDSITNKIPTEARGVKIHLYTTKNFLYSPLGTFKTTRGRERVPEQLAEDYQKSLSALGRLVNLFLNLEFVKAERKFKITYPSNNFVQIDILTKPIVCRQLGHEPTEVIKHKATLPPLPLDVDVKEIEQKARALVYDTGMVVVNLSQQVSQQNSYSGTATMAILEPFFDGVMRNPPRSEMPRVQVTYFDPVLTFDLFRIGDDDQPHPLDWKVGAFVQGLLVGKV